MQRLIVVSTRPLESGLQSADNVHERTACGMQAEVCNPGRRGAAFLEFVVALPFFVLLVSLMMFVFDSAGTAGNVLIQSRKAAWKDRNQVASTEKLDLGNTQEFGRILKLTSAIPSGGLRNGENEEMPQVRWAPDPGVMTPHRNKHSLFAGSWDHRTLPFRSHGRLTFDLRIGTFAPEWLRKIFEILSRLR